jgi:pimeloyl-ACP methyl ester carboxylesterase
VHGWPQHWWEWRELIGPLAERYRVICPDIRGMGWSDAPRTGYHQVRLVADLIGLLDALELERVRLIGHDWGLVTGYRACLDHPDRVERFVPMAGVHPWTPSDPTLYLFARAWHIYVNASPLGALTTKLGLPEIALRTWRRAGRFTAEEIEIYTAPLRRPLSANATRQRYRNIVFREIPWFLLHHRRLRLRVPTLHLNGECDPLTRTVQHGYRRYADDMRLEHVPGAGHFPAEENPGYVLDRVVEFLA